MKIYCMPYSGSDPKGAVRSLLKHAVWGNYGIIMPEIEKTKGGKPYFPSLSNIHFSLSHAKAYVLCAVSDSPVGIDIECGREVSKKLIKRVCTEKELSEFSFFELWTLKESFVKLHGGWTMEMRDMHFTKKDDAIISEAAPVYGKLYHNIDGFPVAACSFKNDFPDEVIVVTHENIISDT